MLKILSAAILLAFTAGQAMAAGDPEAGAITGYTCTGCHGIPGYVNVYPTFHVPKVAGQNAAYIEAALKAYRSGDRKHSTMNLHAQGLSDQEIADIAAWMESAGDVQQ